MRFQFSSSLLFVASSAGSIFGVTMTAASSFTPHRIHYEDLLVDPEHQHPHQGGVSLLEALDDSSGIVVVTNLPDNFSQLKKEVLAHLHACLLEQQEQQQQEEGQDDAEVVVAEQAFRDGTLRRTLATATTLHEGGPLPLSLRMTQPASSCAAFNSTVQQFRTIAETATTKFAQALSDELAPDLHQPVLHRKQERQGGTDNKNNNNKGDAGAAGARYNTIADLVRHGDTLEHFHSYQKVKKTAAAIGEEYNDDDDDEEEEEAVRMETIELHADQGFFIAFTPGMLVEETAVAASASVSSVVSTAGGFYIVEKNEEEEDGTFEKKKKNPIHVEFDIDTDDLVFMLGDGVNQYINNRMIDSGTNRRALRATPHAVSLNYHAASSARVWYGRMVLPPSDALVVLDDQAGDAEHAAVQTTLTYGDVRRRLIDDANKSNDAGAAGAAAVPTAGLGCSQPNMRALQGGLHDQPSACAKGSLFCWARCMELDEYDLTEELCAEQNLDLQCINPRGQFSTGERHGDFWPACTNSTQEETPYPEILQHDDDVCTEEAWDAFLASFGDYDHTFDLSNEKNSGAALQWSVVDEEQGIIRGRLAFGDVYGWLSFGFASEGGKHNGMNDGNILMAIPGTDYTPATGLVVPGMTVEGSDAISIEVAKSRAAALIDTTINPLGSSVNEYHIDPDGSSFRHWSEPTGMLTDDGQGPSNVIVTDCFTAMTFEINSINGKYFNVTGVDDVMWGGNSMDYHVGYHGRGNRARFYINWMTGEGVFWEKPDIVAVVVEEKDDGNHSHNKTDDDDDSGASYSGSLLLASTAAAIATSVAAITTSDLF